MALKVNQVSTWAAWMEDRPGNLAAKLDVLAKAGANLEFVIARRTLEDPGNGVVFVTPIRGAAEGRTARAAGFHRSESLHAVRIEGSDKPGQVVKIAQALAEKGLNLHGLCAATLGRKFVVHILLEDPAEVSKAIRVLKKL